MFFKSDLEETLLNKCLDVKFDNESDGDGPEAQQPYLDPLHGPY